ncbi:ead/Ea22-like family protein [Salmonella enterica subsp. enterica serovar Offa]|nr:ead/Ea22-like family protein [Salmonella enterica subsp. enterica serovar Offa]ECB6233963.1 ead/Ea22-like family protein [Salmonella enterica subsp. enterica serovar Minnesota]EDH9411630.1 ead/Ea22-like family protein [Salmonella enterica subsp. enterica serovar Infantis]EDW1519141.1 ead/Ea22-like family protein [Salmonella enterica subsp. houtenae]EEP9460642.1 ead/Ea22-like family protein [Salmonella enterica]
MSNIDKQALRERYSPKPAPECHICGAEMTIQRMSAGRITYGCTGSTYDDKGCHYAEGRSIADDHYELSRVTVIDVSDPEVLALLDERERNQQYIKRRDQENEDIALTVGKLRVELEAAENNLIDSECHVAELEEALRDKQALLEESEKRIAELESNEVREVGNQFLVVRHPGKTPVIKHCTGDPEEFLRKLIEQDPLVTIDIITHRYYGIGGQWVQDAVEYLHMMSDAGIRIKGE